MRLFIATSFPEEILRDLNERVSRVRPRLPAASWVRPETQHLTFAFLGEQPEKLLETIGPAMTSALGGIPRFEATLRGCGFFPNARHARVGWVGISPEDRFSAAAQAVRTVVKANGIELDGGEFRAHLTLMRVREGWPPASIELFNRTLQDYRSTPFTVDAITLYSSQLNPHGAVHTAERKFALGTASSA